MSSPQIRVDAGRLEIRSLIVDDPCVVKYVSSFDQAMAADALTTCLQVGARALSCAADQSGATLLTEMMKQTAESQKLLLETVSNQTRETVERSVAELPKNLQAVLGSIEKDLLRTLDPESASSIVGRLYVTLVTGLAKETEKIARALDLRNPNSQLSQLNDQHDRRQAKVEEQLQKIAGELQARAAVSVVRRKTTGKGISFEDILEAYIADESRPRHDVVLRTSKTTGIDGNDTGDVTVEVEKSHAHGPGLYVVFEAKDAQVSFPALVRDVEKAMRNRSAAFGIGVTTNPDITRGSSLIVPVGDDKLIVCAPQIADEEFELLGVALALEMGRWKAIMSRVAPSEQMDLNRINAHVSASFSVMRRFSEGKKKMTSIKTSVDDAWLYVDAIRNDLENELGNLRRAITEEMGSSMKVSPEPNAA